MLYIFKVRYQDVITNRFFKFLTVGGFGTFVQISALVLLKTVFGTASSLRLQIVNLIAIECAIFSNFILNNLWTFADKKLQLREFPKKFLHFNVASAGSVLIQTIIMALGLTFIGAKILFSVPVLNFEIDTPVVFSVVGILVGLFWNFFAYSKFVWKKK